MSGSKHMIFLVNNGTQQLLEATELDCITLPHPKGSVPVMYLSVNNNIYEIQAAEPHKYGSFFIDQRVSSDKKIYLANKMDPRFFLLPYFEKSSGKFSPLDQIVTVAPDCDRIPLKDAGVNGLWNMEEICDVKDIGDDMIFYRYNEEKIMKWLDKKISKLMNVLAIQRQKRSKRENTLFIGGFNAGQSINANDSTAMNVEEKDDNFNVNVNATVETVPEDNRVAVQILMDYLSDKMTAKLLKTYGYSSSDMQVNKKQDIKRKADWELEMELEKDTLAYAMPPSGASASTNSSGSHSQSNPTDMQKKKPAPRSNAASKFNGGKPVEAKKSIMNFFGAPPKK
jgi:hypothetical protein